MELAGSLGIPPSELDGRITARDWSLYLDFYTKHGRLPGQVKPFGL